MMDHEPPARVTKGWLQAEAMELYLDAKKKGETGAAIRLLERIADLAFGGGTGGNRKANGDGPARKAGSDGGRAFKGEIPPLRRTIELVEQRLADAGLLDPSSEGWAEAELIKHVDHHNIGGLDEHEPARRAPPPPTQEAAGKPLLDFFEDLNDSVDQKD